ncbi:MAG: hypothetical protein DWQ02_00075, partial [Bacteroidetes bacterium]
MQGQEASIIVQSRTTSEGMAVNWFPTSPQLWKSLMTQGYRVSRVEIDTMGNEIGASVVLANNLTPKDSSWFVVNGNLSDGLMEPIGALMYDPQFDFPENDLMDDTEMKYNFIVYETTRDIQIANAVGLGFLDSTVVEDKHYKYDITAVNGGYSAFVRITNLYYNYGQSGENPVEFTFPDGRSLSDMLAAARPYDPDRIVAMSRMYGDSIVLRWGPTNPKFWKRAMEEGYKIYKSVGDGELELLTTVKPWPESEIKESIASDSMALVAAGILYSDNSKYNIQDMSIGDQIAIFENNYGFSLYAAERSPLAADILGLRYVDKDVMKDSLYNYIITTESIIDPFHTGRISKTNTYVPVPQPYDLTVVTGDKALTLVWNLAKNKKEFVAYSLERSEDGQNYESLTKKPLVFIETDRLPLVEYSFLDSVGVNNKTFYYRLRGYNSFGELSEAAEIEAQARDLTPPTPVVIVQSRYLKTANQFSIEWAEQNGQAEDLANYQVLMSDHPEGQFNAISPVLEKEATSFVLDVGDLDLDQAFFFTVISQDINGNISRAYPSQIAVPDLTAPLPPEVLVGYVDTFSVVHLTWEHSTSKDVSGYWLYWSDDPKAEMAPVNNELLTTNTYAWYIDEKSFNDYIYLCIRAEDDAYNRGVPSKVIKVARLDVMPPVDPIMESVSPENGQMQIR